MRMTTTDPVTGNEVTETENTQFVVEGKGDNALTIWVLREIGGPLKGADGWQLADNLWFSVVLRGNLLQVQIMRAQLQAGIGANPVPSRGQSGTTGINTNRIYHPVKQSLDQDPTGEFIRRWVPELGSIPDGRIHEPWRLTAAEQRGLGVVIGRDYPAPVVDHLEAARAARERLRRFRQGRKDLRIESRAIQARHGSRRRRGRSGPAKRPPPELPVEGE